MKKFFLFLGVIFMTTFFFCSCEQQNKENESPYKLNIYGNSYNLTQAIMWEGNPNDTYTKKEYVWEDIYEDEDGVSTTDKVIGFERGDRVASGNFRLNLFSDGITYMSDASMFIGSGTVVSIHFASESLTELKPGKYTFNKNKTAGTFIGYVATNYEFSGKNQQIVSITEGEVNVEKTTSGYKFTINAKTAANIPFNANYEGELDIVKVAQSKVVNINDITIGALQDSVYASVFFFGSLSGEGFELDTYSPACLSFSAGEVTTTGNSDSEGNNNIHMAAKYDALQKNIVIISPIKVRSIIGHNDDYLCACHTKYKKAVGMTEGDFMAFNGSTIPVIGDSEADVTFSVDKFEPGYFYFEAGDGTSGLVRVKAILPPKDCVDFELGGLMEIKYTLESQLVIDVKATTNYGNPKI